MDVFLVEDAPLVRDRLVSLLHEIPKVNLVGEASSFGKAQELVLSLTPKVMILDISPHGVNAFRFLEKIKEKLPNLTIIVLMNQPFPTYRKRYKELGVEFFFEKSTSFNALAEVLQWMAQRAD
ncbi:MAG TPA: hypothetical protein DCP63_05540 [Bacteroidetes bacterium]|nr:hypothetical protein [Bacteroidota bacterium]